MKRLSALMIILVTAAVCGNMVGCASESADPNPSVAPTQTEIDTTGEKINPYSEMSRDAEEIQTLLVTLNRDIGSIVSDVIEKWDFIEPSHVVVKGDAEYLSLYAVIESYEESGQMLEIEIQFTLAKGKIEEFQELHKDVDKYYEGVTSSLNGLYDAVWDRYHSLKNLEGKYLEYTYLMNLKEDEVNRETDLLDAGINACDAKAALLDIYL